ncbi:TatD family hydrolase [Geobacter sp. AOG2]|uniref:TatD family hydrolase n=1 Tax=Geobacter sp. AOG2 TaxID=1566347 RepID=UPI001CC82AEB|nr:TatD family hydrolase [Geobacter sp. AOG2]GFE59610.1 TatD family hydrolase [Geobacter sp. AOG2]
MYPNQLHAQSEIGTGLIDTHCHLDLAPLITHLPQVLARAHKAGVQRFVVPGVHPDGWSRIMTLAAVHHEIVPAVGVHPMYAALADDGVLTTLAGAATGSAAIGEIGLDPAYPVPLEIQEMAFRQQLRLAVSQSLPVLVHCRRAFQRTLQILREEKADNVGGIMHAFSGSPEMAREFIRLGFAIALSGTLTWRGAVRPPRLAREIPLEHLVLETDAPDMPPQGHRGEANQPAWLVETLSALAAAKNITPDTVATATHENSVRVLGLV